MIVFETDKKPLTFLLDQIRNRELALPDFQRSFVWDAGATRELVVSILRSFPAGSLLLMQGGGEIFAPRAVEEAPALSGNPSYLVLDGQQRLTSLFQAFAGLGAHRFFLNLQRLIDDQEQLDEAVEVFSSKAAAKWLDPAMQAQDLMLPLSHVGAFSPWRSAVQKAYAAAGEDVDKLEAAFIEIEQRVIKAFDLYQFPVTTLAATTPAEAVCTIFETLNRTGVKLSVFELITARAFANEVLLRDMWSDALSQHRIIEDFGVDPYYVLQAIAVVVAHSAKRSAVLSLNVEDIVKHWDAAIAGLAGSLKLLRDDCGVLESKWLPYATMLVTMTAAWSGIGSAKGPTIGARIEKLKRWFWCSVFTGSYENGPNSATERDVPELLHWFEDGEEPESVYGFSFDSTKWREITVRQRALYRATIALLMSKQPRDFHQAITINKGLIESAGIDDHHVFPRAYLSSSRQGEAQVDTVLNHTLIDKLTNIRISAKPPSIYLQEMKGELQEKLPAILDSHGLPSDEKGPLWRDDFPGFLVWRESHLAARLKEVTGMELINQHPPRTLRAASDKSSSMTVGAGIPLRAMQLIEARSASDAIKYLVIELTKQFAALPDVVVKAGTSAKTDDGLGRAIQLHRRGSRHGAFAYVIPRGSVVLRLQGIDPDRFSGARIRNVRERDPYKIRAPLSTPEDKETAFALTQLAYEAAL